MLKAVAIAAVVGTALVSVSFATADPNLGNIAPHRHYILTPTGARIQVGPDVCDNPNLQHAFNEFHVNLHRLSPDAIGPVAPGLHNGLGAEIVAGPC